MYHVGFAIAVAINLALAAFNAYRGLNGIAIEASVAAAIFNGACGGWCAGCWFATYVMDRKYY